MHDDEVCDYAFDELTYILDHTSDTPLKAKAERLLKEAQVAVKRVIAYDKVMKPKKED